MPNMKTKTIKGPKNREALAKEPEDTVNFPCAESLSPFHHQKLITEMELYPSDVMTRRYCRKIPFKGTKSQFYETTAREHFTVFEYRFTAPNVNGEMKQWWIMWDYFNGLVRVHDFFDCCKPGKTEPGNALKEKVNPGLSDMCPNITGGNLHAQGYWFPFEAAKAIAAKFCYRIRYALTIIFGDDFPNMCLPEEHEDFGKYNIDPEIIGRCKAQMDVRKREIQQRNGSRQSLSSGYATPLAKSPAQTYYYTPSPDRTRPAPLKLEEPAKYQYSYDAVRNEMRPRPASQSPVLSSAAPSPRLINSPSIQSYAPNSYPAQGDPYATPRMHRPVITNNNRHHPYAALQRRGTNSTVSSAASYRASEYQPYDNYRTSYCPENNYAPAPPTPEFSPQFSDARMSYGHAGVAAKDSYFSTYAAARQESPIRWNAVEYDSRRSYSGQISPPLDSPAGSPQYDHQMIDADDPLYHRSRIPSHPESYTRLSFFPPIPQTQQTECDRDIELAAAGLMEMRRSTIAQHNQDEVSNATH
ncbi:hypothetical protein FPQ18DRAFT_407808 [Pyronema domesticum]|nr:hypothetical protein FPQ18DRAFT_407808 [Pyronema domesticum]